MKLIVAKSPADCNSNLPPQRDKVHSSVKTSRTFKKIGRKQPFSRLRAVQKLFYGQLDDLDIFFLRVWNQPVDGHAVILFDEVEKAHPDVMNLLLQILEEGSVTDSLGRKINFRNTIIILTSNVGAASAKRQSTMGFGAMAADNADYAAMKEKILEVARKQFRPEFLNRFDDISVFRMLERDDLERIVHLEADKLISRLKTKNITLALSQEALSLIIKNGYDPQYGARPMRRAIERLLEDPLAESLLRGDVKPGDKIEAVETDGTETLTFLHIQDTPPAKPKAPRKRTPRKPKVE